MREQYMGQEGRIIREGDKVEITFYSYMEPLSSITGTVEGNYLNVESGAMPLGNMVYCKEIRLIESEDDMDKVKIEIELTTLEILKLGDLTDMILIDKDGYCSDDEISDAISILLKNLRICKESEDRE